MSSKLSNTMAATFDFPLFAPMQIEPNPNSPYDYLMCLWTDKNQESKEFCGETCGDFYKLLAHLRQDHGLNLQSRIDFCFDCEVIFSSRLDSIVHHLTKALSTETFEMVCENDASETEAIKAWLTPVYQSLNGLRKIVMNRILYSDDMPEFNNQEFFTDDGGNDGTDQIDGTYFDSKDS